RRGGPVQWKDLEPASADEEIRQREDRDGNHVLGNAGHFTATPRSSGRGIVTDGGRVSSPPAVAALGTAAGHAPTREHEGGSARAGPHSPGDPRLPRRPLFERLIERTHVPVHE